MPLASAPTVHRASGKRLWVILAALILATASVPLWLRIDSSPDSPKAILVVPTVPSSAPAVPSPSQSPPAVVEEPPPAAPRSPTSSPRRSPAGSGIKPVLSVVQAAVPQFVDLTAEGTLDWVHWGFRNAQTVDRKQGGSGAIHDDGSIGVRTQDFAHPQFMTWHDGTPTLDVFNTPSGVFTCGPGTGFLLHVDAGPTIRTLKLYVGVFKAAGRLEAELSTGGLSATATLGDQLGKTAVFTIAFRTAKPATLRLRWTASQVFDPGCGNVNVQAVTLA
jgi:hypothetical protein